MNHIITGGSADRSGIIQLGDIVVSVDSRDVRGKVSLASAADRKLTLIDFVWLQPLAELRSSFVGPEGRFALRN